MKSDFINELCQSRIEAAIIFGDRFNFNDSIEKIMIEHWPYFLDGTYGVCLKEVSAQNIVLKAIAVSILEEWLNSSVEDKRNLYDKAHCAAKLYDELVCCFGPHEVFKSTRERLFKKVVASLND